MDVGLTSIFVTLAVAHFLALLSPGSDFILVVKVPCVIKEKCNWYCSRYRPSKCWIHRSLSGWCRLHPLCISFNHDCLKIVGGLFLIYLAIQALKARRSSYETFEVSESEGASTHSNSLHYELVTGFMSGILNPKICCTT